MGAVLLAVVAFGIDTVVTAGGGSHGPGLVLTKQAGLYSVTFRITPNAPGSNTFSADIKSPANSPAASAVHVIQTMVSMNMGTLYVGLRPVSPGLFSGTGSLSMAGEWRFELLVSLHGRSQPVTTVFEGDVGA